MCDVAARADVPHEMRPSVRRRQQSHADSRGMRISSPTRVIGPGGLAPEERPTISVRSGCGVELVDAVARRDKHRVVSDDRGQTTSSSASPRYRRRSPLDGATSRLVCSGM